MKKIFYYITLLKLIIYLSILLQKFNFIHITYCSFTGVERVFSSFGLGHTKLCNHLGIEKTGILVFLFKLLSRKPLDTVDDDDND